MRKTFLRAALLMAASIILLFAGNLIAQGTNNSLFDFWKIGDEYKYLVTAYNANVGYSTGTFVGAVKHSEIGNAYLFKTETTIGVPGTGVGSKVTSELFTEARGYPMFYQSEYIDKGETRKLMGYQIKSDFDFKETIDTTQTSFQINISPSTVLCDRQCIPQWNIAFFNEPDVDRDTIIFSVLIPYLKTRARMTMIRQADTTLTVLGKETPCRVYYSIRTDEYYFITPDRHVARVTLPKQGLIYELVSVKAVPPPEPMNKPPEPEKKPGE
jgi:hypothetical protein